MDHLVIAPGDPRADDVRAVLELHLAFAREVTPPEDVHALDVDGLLDPAVSFFTVRRDGALVAVGALRELDPTHVEMKSMHVVVEARGNGFGRWLVEQLMALARERGYARMSVETGTMEAFAAARALYRGLGFEECPPFGEYFVSPSSVCMTRDLAHGS